MLKLGGKRSYIKEYFNDTFMLIKESVYQENTTIQIN